ncbi:MAG: AAA family ATPase, partial [Ruminococcus sp.]|nr:AAA family ATPase [Ruminococcus sp.]
GNALALAEELGCTVRTIDIKAAVTQHFSDIGHDSGNYDVVYENAQARERTQILMDVANAERGLVVGTGDLSELALGFATYNGDHMSMYCVNGSVPKTLMRAIINYAAERAEAEGNSRLATVLLDVINTPVSPELLPTDGAENNQHTEKIVGPYELHDFFLYHTVVSGVRPDRLLELAVSVFPEYDHGEIRGYLDIFIRRFISQQFKRSCMPDGPRVTKISLSPRGAWSMPSDISGFTMLDPQKNDFVYREGAVMCNFLLADEINRASPKVQSALLEAMEEHQISLDGVTRQLPKPFLVMATQNPVETYGTFHLPEAQMDRFFMKLSMGYPSEDEEIKILERTEMHNPITNIEQPVMSLEDIEMLQNEVRKVRVTEQVKSYIVNMVSATRNDRNITLGISPRGSIALYKASKAFAYIYERDYVTPDDVKNSAVSVLSHRIILSPQGKTTFGTNEEYVKNLLNSCQIPGIR